MTEDPSQSWKGWHCDTPVRCTEKIPASFLWVSCQNAWLESRHEETLGGGGEQWEICTLPRSRKIQKRLENYSTLKGNKERWQPKATCALRLVLNQKIKRNIVETVGKFWVRSVITTSFLDWGHLWVLVGECPWFEEVHTEIFRGMRDVYNLFSNSSEKQ